MFKILIVEDDRDLCNILSAILEAEDYDVTIAETGSAALRKIKSVKPELIILDYNLPDCKGIDLLEKINSLDQDLAVIMLTAHSVVKEAVRAMKLGAFDYLTKPFDNEELLLVIKKALQNIGMKKEISSLRRTIENMKPANLFVGSSVAVRKMLEQVNLVSKTTLSVLLYGESGTGKDLIAKLIHAQSTRSDKPFVALDCGAIPESLIESVLFGHEKGSYTGADSKKEGEFIVANEGTIFLDEITNLPEGAQAKLLRVLQDKVIHPLGSTKKIPVDVRIIAATNIHPAEALQKGKIRQDLFYRLNEFSIWLPPLRERKDDIIALSEYFLKEAMKEFGKPAAGVSGEADSILQSHDWPGNVRELRNVIRRALLVTKSLNIQPDDIILDRAGQFALSSKNETGFDLNADETLLTGDSLQSMKKIKMKQLEKSAIIKALTETGGNKSKAAKLLKIDRATLYAKLKEYNI